MQKAEITFHAEYPDTFDFEDLRTIFHRALDDAKERGLLDLPASENTESGEVVKCTAIYPDWLCDD
ncbi:hypothetical protein K5D56_26230 [Pseudomonas cichorii]|nr:hypothetical protein [Pseudomonas cichorii]MBX8557009.1 hypothetical protein [Pseudomonas cichorii]MBX8592876.1 hypothetical protein [Pseudomonas cichorii]